MKASNSCTRTLVLIGLMSVLCLGSALAAEVHFRCDNESDVVRAQFNPGDQIPLGGYQVDIGWMETFSEDAWMIADPSCDRQSTMALMLSPYRL